MTWAGALCGIRSTSEVGGVATQLLNLLSELAEEVRRLFWEGEEPVLIDSVEGNMRRVIGEGFWGLAAGTRSSLLENECGATLTSAAGDFSMGEIGGTGTRMLSFEKSEGRVWTFVL